MSVVKREQYQSFDVPRDNETALVRPSLPQIVETTQAHQFPPDDSPVEFCGKGFTQVRDEARQEVFSLAQHFTSQYRNTNHSDIKKDTKIGLRPLILSGHQPELFHPGVWFKNFLLSRVAEQSGGVAINFLVDNDLCRTTSIRVPSRQANGAIIAQSVPFDGQRKSTPWELRRVNSMDCFKSFPKRVAQAQLQEMQTPLLHELWPNAIQAALETDRIGLALAQARHQLEHRIGLDTLEVPLSHLVSTRAFARFSIQTLSELPRLQEIYNRQRNNYRLAHNIRSHAHPVPPLEQQDGWLEAPWWIYRSEVPERQRMWVRLLNDQLILSDRAGWQAVIEGRLDCDNASSQWLDLLSDGICLRPRALLTTMYLRMIVGDMFFHGIGGGKYDQLTDLIIREFFGLTPPPMAVATATLHLPLASAPDLTSESASAAERAITTERKRIWKLRYNADTIADQLDGEAEELAARKRHLLENIPERGSKWEWHREITSVNRRLSELASEKTAEAKEHVASLADDQRQLKVLESREFSFALYPLEFVSKSLNRLSMPS